MTTSIDDPASPALRWAACACLMMTVLAAGCRNTATVLSGPSSGSPSIAFTQVSPASGSTISTTGSPPGAFIQRGSGKLSVGLVIQSADPIPYAELRVYLLTNDASGYCGQNLPDAPVWTALGAGAKLEVTITGFQVYRLPCDVTGLRAMLTVFTNDGRPPAASQTLAEATYPVTYQLR
jgi:hypothetical protein